MVVVSSAVAAQSVEHSALLAAGAPLVRAAGGVVWRVGARGVVEVLVVHRPKYRDWTFPKGKVDPGEADHEAALREVEEETGLRCWLGPELASTAYVDRKERPKIVRYWVMAVADGTFRPCAEVDRALWLPPPDARRVLSYDRDRSVLTSFELDGRRDRLTPAAAPATRGHEPRPVMSGRD